ncbi:MAG: GAF domain-containing sensor histidine kinase [Anaerolineales bacterium]|nr:GAF domain-containing sensor histidine kinase [Anaerolineales bacterium]
MAPLAAFFAHHIDVVYFLYGLAFFSMGLAVLLESGRASEFRLARAMGSLAGFGILHGVHEWMEMFQRLGKFDQLPPDFAFFFNGIHIGALLLSFLLLVTFGIRLVYSDRRPNGNERAFALGVAGSLAIFWLFSVLLTQWVYRPTAEEMARGADVLSRYIVGIPGALLTAWAVYLEQRTFRIRGMPDFGRALTWAAVAILLYGAIGQLFVTPSFLFPATFLNADLFLRVTGFPVQIFRAAMAGLMALFMIRALRVFELESRQRLSEANEARLAAQRTALDTQRKARVEVEELNRELQTAVQDLTMLFQVSRNLNATLDKKTLLENTLLQIAETLPRIEGGLIMMRMPPDDALELITSLGYYGKLGTLRPGECTFDRAYKLGQHVAQTGDIALCTGSEVVPIGHVGTIMLPVADRQPLARAHTVGVPLTIHEQVRGSLVMSAGADTQPFTMRDVSLLATVGGQLSIALENATLYEEVQTRDALRGELLHQVVSAQEKERQRVARELHDGTGQTLTALGMGLAAATDSAAHSPDQAIRQLHDLRELSNHALQEVHDVIADLRPSLLDNLGLVPALRSQVQGFEQRMRVKASLAVSGERHRLDPDVEIVVFRIAQEALTNVAKHARAQTVTVQLTFAPRQLALTITDDGRGFDPQAALRPSVKGRQAWGLFGMQERVALVGGTCDILSTPGQGTRIHVEIPLQFEEVAHVDNQVDARR